MLGLTFAETLEFRLLDEALPFDEHGEVAWVFGGPPLSQGELRWQELWEKHRAAVLLAEKAALEFDTVPIASSD